MNIGTLFYHASQNGYKPSREVASAPRKPKINAETRKQIQAAAAAATQQENLRVKLLAQNIWSQSRKASPDHPYLQRKQITDQTCLTSVRLNQYKGQNNIIVPIFYNGEIVNLESIYICAFDDISSFYRMVYERYGYHAFSRRYAAPVDVRYGSFVNNKFLFDIAGANICGWHDC